MKCFLLSGKSGHGKDYFAEILKDNLIIRGQKVLTIHFADCVKMFAKTYYNWDGDKSRPKGRALLQYVGTDLMRKYDPDYWCRIVGEFLAAADNDFDIALIPDTRFPNEIEVVHKYCPQAKTIRVQRWTAENEPYVNPALTNVQLQHPSETSLDNYQFDYLINNYEGKHDVLIKAANGIIEDLTLKKN